VTNWALLHNSLLWAKMEGSGWVWDCSLKALSAGETVPTETPNHWGSGRAHGDTLRKEGVVPV